MRFQKERPEQQEVGLQGRRENDRLRRQQETPEQHQECRLQAERETQWLRRQQESLEQREQRLQADRERRWLQRQQETTDQRRQSVDARRLHQYSIDKFECSLQATLSNCLVCSRILFSDKAKFVPRLFPPPVFDCFQYANMEGEGQGDMTGASFIEVCPSTCDVVPYVVSVPHRLQNNSGLLGQQVMV